MGSSCSRPDDEYCPTVECASPHKPPSVFVQNWLPKVAMEEGDGPFHHRVPGLLGGVAPLQKQGMDAIRVKQTVMWASYWISLGFLHSTFHLPSQHAHQLLSGQYRLRVNKTVAWHKQIALGLGIMGTWTASDSGMKPTGEKCTRKESILSSGTELHPLQHRRHPSPPWNSCWDQENRLSFTKPLFLVTH